MAQYLSKLGTYSFEKFRTPDIWINYNIYMHIFLKQINTESINLILRMMKLKANA